MEDTVVNPTNAINMGKFGSRLAVGEGMWELKVAPTMCVWHPFLFARFELSSSGFLDVLVNIYL